MGPYFFEDEPLSPDEYGFRESQARRSDQDIREDIERMVDEGMGIRTILGQIALDFEHLPLDRKRYQQIALDEYARQTSANEDQIFPRNSPLKEETLRGTIVKSLDRLIAINGAIGPKELLRFMAGEPALNATSGIRVSRIVHEEYPARVLNWINTRTRRLRAELETTSSERRRDLILSEIVELEHDAEAVEGSVCADPQAQAALYRMKAQARAPGDTAMQLRIISNLAAHHRYLMASHGGAEMAEANERMILEQGRGQAK